MAGAGTIQPIAKTAAAINRYKQTADSQNAMDSKYEMALPDLDE